MAQPTPPHKSRYPGNSSGQRKQQPARPVYTYNADAKKQPRKQQSRPIVYDYDKMIEQEERRVNTIDVPQFTPKANTQSMPGARPQPSSMKETGAPAHPRKNPAVKHVQQEMFEPPLREPQRPHSEMYNQHAHENGKRTAQQPAPNSRKKVKGKRPSRKKTPKTPGEARRRRVRRTIMASVFAIILLIAGVFVSATVLFKIKTITVESTGEALMYENNQIKAVFGHPAGENLFGFRIKETQQAIEQALPYLQKVKIKRRLPDEIVITAEPAVETYTVENAQGGWAVLSGEGKVLRVTQEIPEGLMRIAGAQADAPLAGNPVKFTEEDKLQALEVILKTAAKQELGPINEINLSDMMEISLLYQDRIRIVLGTVNDMEYKIEWAWKLVTPEQTENSLGAEERGTLDVSSRGNDGLGRACWRAGVL